MKYFLLLFALVLSLTARAQLVDQYGEPLVQFSGMVLDGTNNQLQPIPYATVLIKSDGRGTYANLEGFFSIVAHKGDTILFSALGYDDVEFIIDPELEDDKYSLVQLMTYNAIDLPEAVVFPWPSREHFKLEFLAMDVTPRATDPRLRKPLRRQAGAPGRDRAPLRCRKQQLLPAPTGPQDLLHRPDPPHEHLQPGGLEAVLRRLEAGGF